MNLSKTLRSPYQDPQKWRVLLPLALLQFVPIIGQLILVGYGQAVARAVASDENLPPINLIQSAVDGLKLVAVGLVICLPIFITVLLMFSTMKAPAANEGGPPMAIFPVVMITVLVLSNQITKRKPDFRPIINIINHIIGLGFIIFIVFRLRGLLSLFQNGLQFNAVTLTSTTYLILAVAAVVLAIFMVIILIHGVRYTLSGTGLLNPRDTLKGLVASPISSLRFIGTTWLLTAIILMGTALGGLLLLLPGAVVFAAGGISLWSATTQFCITCGIVEN